MGLEQNVKSHTNKFCNLSIYNSHTHVHTHTYTHNTHTHTHSLTHTPPHTHTHTHTTHTHTYTTHTHIHSHTHILYTHGTNLQSAIYSKEERYSKAEIFETTASCLTVAGIFVGFFGLFLYLIPILIL